MELIVSTAQGEAEVSVNAVHESVTIADLLARVLTSTPPAVVYIDGRPTPTGTLLTAAGLVNGAVIDVLAPADRALDTDVTLVQAAGDGGGTRRPLEPGRYSLGTARRANVAPLSMSQVLVPRCELIVEHSGHVTVVANQGDLDGHLAAMPTLWSDKRLRIGHRVFRLDGRTEDQAAPLTPTPLGQLNFIRPPREPDAVEPEPEGSRNGSRRGRRTRNKVEPPAPPAAVVDAARVAYAEELDAVRRTHFDLGEVVRRATQRSTRLWERRPGNDDAFVFSVGLADQPSVVTRAEHPDRRDVALLPSVPVLVDLANERGVGFAGTPPQARAAARALVLQACVAHSPSDLDVVVLASHSGAARWEWVKWLPHARGAHGVQLLSDEEAISDWVTSQRTLTTVVASIQSLGRPITPSRLTLAVVDDPALWRGRAAMLRGLFAEAQLPVRFVAITDRADDVPAVCTTVVRIEANGSAEVDYPLSGPTVTDVVPFVLDHDVAVAAARKLSPLEDHSAQMFAKAVLPPIVPLMSLIDPDGLDAGRVLERWRASRKGRRLRIPIGVGEAGVVEIDLTEDGPHMLVVGAPRSGKTDLLRAVVAAVVSSEHPAAVNVITVEPSDGSTFGAFAGADHIVGKITDFDEHGGLRLLRALQSEIGRRARLLADVHASNLADYHAAERHAADEGLPPLAPIARLVIAVDDADDIMARHAAFLPQLIDLADRSRHLGVHVIVAAEQLTRSIEHTLKSFANVRVALRMNDPAQAIALIGSREPVQISLHAPGRGALRVGAAEPVHVQFASAAAASGELMEVAPFTVARDVNAAERKLANQPGRGTTRGDRGDIERAGVRQLVDVVASAAASIADRHQRRILCPELPTDLPYAQLAGGSTSDGAAFALSDLPDDHTQNVRMWNPPHDGNILIVGGSPPERSSALATMVVSAVDTFGIGHLHVYVLDCSPGQQSRLNALERLPACAAVASTDDPDRIFRVLLALSSELDRRSTHERTANDPHIVLLINDVGLLLRTLELGGEFEQGRDALDRLISNGPTCGITTVMTSAGEHGAPTRMLAQFQQRILLHLDDRGAYRALDIESGRIPRPVPGRAITLPDLVELQIASIDDLAAAVTTRAGASDGARGVVTVPRTPDGVSAKELAKATSHSPGCWAFAVGLDTATLQPALLHARSAAGALLLGGAGTGKSALLANMARHASGTDPTVEIHAIAATRSALLQLPGLAGSSTLAGIERWAADFFTPAEHERLVLVDDADRLEGSIFEQLVTLRDPRLVIVVAGRTRDLEVPTHWTTPLRAARSAVILRPVAGDGAIFGMHLRIGSTPTSAGRGLLIDNDVSTPILLPGDSDDVRGKAS